MVTILVVALAAIGVFSAVTAPTAHASTKCSIYNSLTPSAASITSFDIDNGDGTSTHYTGSPTGSVWGDEMGTPFSWAPGQSVDACNNADVATTKKGNLVAAYDGSTMIKDAQGNLAFQCVELIDRYDLARWGENYTWGDASSDWANGHHPIRFAQHANGDIYAPQIGDILIWPDSGPGHIAIIATVSGNTLTTLEQNFYYSHVSGDQPTRTIQFTSTGGHYTIGTTYTVNGAADTMTKPLGWLHADDTSGNLSKSVGQISAGSSTGALIAFKHNTSDSVSYRYQTTAGGTTWSAWATLPNPSGDTIVGHPTVAKNIDGRLFVFARAASGKIWLLTQSSASDPTQWVAWSNFTNPSGETMVSDPAVAAEQDGKLYMFVLGASGMVRVQNQTTPGGAWLSTGYSQFANPANVAMVGNPTIAAGEDGRLYVFVRDVNGQVRLQNQTSVNGPWLSTGYTQFANPANITMVGDPIVAPDADNSLNLFVRDNTGVIRTQYQTSPNGPWNSAGFGQIANPANDSMVGAPAVVRSADGRLYLFVLDQNGQIRLQNQTTPKGAWLTGYTQFSNPSGITMSGDPDAGTDSTGIVQLFSVGSDQQLYWAHQTSAGGAWAGLAAFGGSFPLS